MRIYTTVVRRKTLRQAHFLTCILLISLGAFSGAFICHGQASAASIKVGAVLPLTGWAAASGSYVLDGAKIAVEEINAAGGVKGVKLEIVALDGKADPAESLNATERLINRDKVSIIFGAWLSSATLAIVPAVQRHEVPLVVETSGHPKITQPVNKWVFRFSPTFKQEAEGLAKCFPSLGMKKVAFVSLDNDWGRGAVEAYSAVLNKQGIQTVLAEYVAAAVVDFYPQLTKIKGSGADAILMTHDAPAVAKLLQQRKELGLQQTVLSTGGGNWPDAEIRLAGPEAAEGSYYASFFPAFQPEAAENVALAKKFIETWKKRGLIWDGVEEGSRGYDAISVISKAIELANGSDNRAKIRDALEKVDIKGLNARIKFDANHDAEPYVKLSQIKNGKGIIVKCD